MTYIEKSTNNANQDFIDIHQFEGSMSFSAKAAFVDRLSNDRKAKQENYLSL